LGLRSGGTGFGGGRQAGQLVLLNPTLRVNCALLIDRLSGLRDRDQLTLVDVEVSSRPAFAPRQWSDSLGRRWEELDLAALVRDPAFLDVAA
jgi:twitching motility protein PilI